MLDPQSSQWFVVRTHARSEVRAAENIERQGFPTYLPRYLKAIRHARRRVEAATPLFPCYLFVSIDVSTQRWRVINSSFGVSQLVGMRDRPTPLAHSIVASIKEREDENGFVRLGRASSNLRPGASVSIQGGPFENCHGIFEAACDAERVLILLDLMGRKVRVALSENSVVAL